MLFTDFSNHYYHYHLDIIISISDNNKNKLKKVSLSSLEFTPEEIKPQQVSKTHSNPNFHWKTRAKNTELSHFYSFFPYLLHTLRQNSFFCRKIRKYFFSQFEFSHQNHSKFLRKIFENTSIFAPKNS